MNRDEHETETLELHYRVTLDFRMLVKAITPEVCVEKTKLRMMKRLMLMR
jgi:sulfur relay (sulfurtransferase) DsrC/TusE family protein